MNTSSIAPVVHADDKVELTGMVQQSDGTQDYRAWLRSWKKRKIFLSNLKLFQMTSMINLMKMRLNSHEAPDLIAYQFADLFAAVDPEEFLFH